MNKGTRIPKQTIQALVALLLTLAPMFFAGAALAQTEPPQTLSDQLPVDPGVGNLSPGAQQTRETVPGSAYADAPGEVPLVYTAATNNTTGVIQNVTNTLLGTGELGYINDTYMGIKRFWGDDIIGNLFQNIGQLIGKWISEWINGWVADTVRFLTAFLRTFVLNPNIAVNGIQNGPGAGQPDDISPYVRAAADVMYGIAVDLLLLLFILAIWKYWADAAWRGGAGLMGSVGRLIFTAALLLAWPTIYAFIIQITNEMIQAIYFNSADDIMRLDAAMASAVKGGLMAGAGLLAHAFAPVVGGAAGGLALGLVGEIVAFAGLVIYLIIGGILIAQLIYILVLKAIQTALLTAQYMFGPIFLVFFATPDTENVASGYVKSFVEVSLWTFVWVGLLKIMVIILFSDFNPWGKIVMAIGVLQLMVQVPSFLARAQISPMSDFVSAGLITGGILGVGKHLAKAGPDLMDRFAKWRGSLQDGGARGPQQTQSVKMNGLPHGAQDPEALNKIQNAAKGDLNGAKKPGDPTKKENPNGQPLKPLTAEDRKKQEEEEKKKREALKNQGVTPEQAKAVTGADGTTGAVPPKKDTAGDALVKGAATGAALGGLASVLAGANAAEGAKKGTTGTGTDQAAKDRDAAEMAKMMGLDTATDGAAAAQQLPQKPLTEKEKKEKEEADAKAKGALGGQNTPKLTVSSTDATGKKDGTGKEEKKESAVPVLPPVTPATGKKPDVPTPGLNAVDEKGRPLKVSTTGDGSGNEKGTNNVEATQETEGLQTGTNGVKDTTLKVNQTDGKTVTGKVGDPKLNVDAKDQTGKTTPEKTGTGAGTGAPIVPPKSNASTTTNQQGQQINTKTGETLQTGQEQVTGQQEHEIVSLGQGIDGRGINLKVTQTPTNRAGQPITGQGNVQVVPPTRQPGAMGQQTAAPVTGAHANLGQNTAGAAATGNPDMTTMNVPEALQDIAGPPKFDPYVALDHSGYGGVAPNIMAKLIRTYDGVSMGKSPDGLPTIVGSPRGVAHVRFGANATQEQKAMQIASAGYAQTMTDDAEAFDAARQSAIDSGADQPRGFADRVAANWMQYKGSSWRETYRAKRQFQQAMFSNAVEGAQAYVTGDEQGSNAFTDHLRTRFGDMTPEKQAWMLHTLTDNTSPESGFGTARWPATDALVSANMGIDPYNRAAMARVLGTNIPVWQRPLAAKGIANYMKGVVDDRATPDTTQEERAAMAGGLTGKLSPAIVDACATIQQYDASPESTLKNPNFVNAVAIRGASYARDPNTREPMRQAYDEEMLKGKMFGGGASSVTTQVTGSIINNGGGGGGDNGGGYSRVVDLPPPTDGGGGSTQYGGSFTPPSAQNRVTQQAQLNYRVGQAPVSRGVNNQPINVAADTSSQRVDTQIISSNPPASQQIVQTQVEAIIQPSNTSAPPVVPLSAIPRVQQHTTNIVDVKIRHQQASIHGQNVSMTVQGESGGPSDVRVGRVAESGSNGQQVIESTATVDVLHSGGDSNVGQVEQLAAQVGQSAPAAMPPGVDIFVEMQQSGFTDQQRRDPNIVAGAAQVYSASGGDRGAMVTAALTARAMGTDTGNFGVKQVQVVQTMIDAGWKANQISAHDIHIAEMVVDHGGDTGGGSGGGYPTPQYIRAISEHPEFKRTPPIGSGMNHAQLKQNNMGVIDKLAGSRYAQRTQQGGIDGYPRQQPQPGGRF